jgi:SAM-dependent methyltransferase
VNSDAKPGLGVVAADIRSGLPFVTDSMEYVVSIHALPELSYPDLVPALSELRRVLQPGGVLRLGLPDLEKSFEAYRRGDNEYFAVPDDEMRSIGGKLVAQLVWFGYSRTFFVRDFAEELLVKAGFSHVDQVAYRETRSPFPDIVELDNRPDESLFVEAVK